MIGANGGLGAALVRQLSDTVDTAQRAGTAGRGGEGAPCPVVLALARNSLPAIDYSNEASLKIAAEWVAAQCALRHTELRLLVVASGFLHGPQGQPERSFRQLDAAYLAHVFQVNTLGPALVMKHFLPLLPKQGRCVAAFMSAKVGSIGDNALGGWYGYRASKAALNQLVKTASIELTRSNKESICVALHPGTVDTGLSQPFAKTGLKVRPPEEAARDVLTVIRNLTPADTGALMDYQGTTLPF